jgi:hypothetical protein
MNQAAARLTRVGLLLTIFLVGWSFSLDLMGSEKIYYTVLTVTAFLSGSLILTMLRGPAKQTIHLWIIFILFVIGYYIKFYILCYFKLDINSEYLDLMHPLESELMNNADLLINYYEMITIILVVFALLIAALVAVTDASRKKYKDYKFVVPRITVKKSTVKRLLGITIVSSLVLIYIQLTLGIGFASAADRQVNPLPYRLAGIIMAIYNGIIPLMFLISLWLADTMRSNYLARLSVGTYLLFGVVAGLISTSKASLITVVVSLIVFWLVTGSFTRKRLLLLLLLVPFMGLFNGFLSINRIMRNIYPDMGIFEIMWMTGSFFLSTDTTLSGYEPVSAVTNYLGLIMRINGADSLMNIINYAPPFSLKRIWHLLFESPDTIATLYAQEVLGYSQLTGVAFSPSLLGYFEFVFGNVVLVSFGMVVFTLIWHLLFRTILRARLLTEPIVFSMLIVLVGLYTSEGTLETMPQSIAGIIVFIIFGEFIIRRLTTRIDSRNSQSSVRA